MSEYNNLIARAAQGEPITTQQFEYARHADEHRAARDAEEQQIAEDVAAARAKFENDKASHQERHQPVIADMIAEVQDAHADVVAAQPALQAAQQTYNQAKAARYAKYRALSDYVMEHYGRRHSMIDLTTGRPHYDTHIGGMEAVIVEGQIILQDGTSRPDGVTGIE